MEKNSIDEGGGEGKRRDDSDRSARHGRARDASERASERACEMFERPYSALGARSEFAASRVRACLFNCCVVAASFLHHRDLPSSSLSKLHSLSLSSFFRTATSLVSEIFVVFVK